MRKAYRNLAALRWDTVIAVLAAVAGAVAMLRLVPATDPMSVLLGRWQIPFGAAYMAAGVLMLVGIARGLEHRLRWIHLAGLGLLATSIAVRQVILVGFVVTDRIPVPYAIVQLVLNAAILWACEVNRRSLRRGDVVAVLGPDR